MKTDRSPSSLEGYEKERESYWYPHGSKHINCRDLLLGNKNLSIADGLCCFVCFITIHVVAESSVAV